MRYISLINRQLLLLRSFFLARNLFFCFTNRPRNARSRCERHLRTIEFFDRLPRILFLAARHLMNDHLPLAYVHRVQNRFHPRPARTKVVVAVRRANSRFAIPRKMEEPRNSSLTTSTLELRSIRDVTRKFQGSS